MSSIAIPPDFHPAIHFDKAGQWASVGFRHRDRKLLLVVREQGAVPQFIHGPDKAPASFREPYELWPLDDLRAFLKDGEAPSFHTLISKVLSVLGKYIEFRHKDEATLVACWILGTYFHPLFSTFPRLNVIGTHQSGKSKLLQVIAACSRDGEEMVAPTHAALFRDADARRHTVCLDEMEHISHVDLRNILAFVNSGYKAGARVPRTEGNSEKGWVVKYYHSYVPVALASIKGVDLVTADRAITLVLERAVSKRVKRSEVDTRDPIFGEIRAAGYRLALVQWLAVVSAVEGVEHAVEGDVLDKLAGRPLELFRPLLALAVLGEVGTHGGTYLGPLNTLATRHCTGQETLPDEEVSLLQEIGRRLEGQEQITVFPKELALALYGDEEKATTVGYMLRRFFEKGPRQQEGIELSDHSGPVRGAHCTVRARRGGVAKCRV